MRVSESIDLIDHKGGKNENCQWIGPELIGPQANYERGLYETMREQVERSEHGATAGQFLRSDAQVMEDDVVLIARELVLAERLQPGVQRVDFEPQQHTADGFENTVDPFYSDAYSEGIVNQDVTERFFEHCIQRATTIGDAIAPN